MPFIQLLEHIMRNFTFTFIIIAFLGCSEQTTEQEISDFEEELGQEEAQGLAEMVKHFERELLERYPNKSLDQVYELHLDYINKDQGLQFGDWAPATLKKDSIFRLYNENLLNEIWIKPDTVWVKDERLYKSYRGNMNPTGHRLPPFTDDIDSLIYFEQNTDIPNREGTFYKALERISKSNKIANWYYTIKREAGNIHSAVIAEALNDHQLDYYDLNEKISYEDYLVKRIILVETYTRTCSSKH
ncbi:hypothetical protein [Ekhidna sp.]